MPSTGNPKEIAAKKGLTCTRLAWCTRMEERLAPEANAHVKGFVQLTVTDFKTGKGHRRGVMYRKSPQDRGFVMNFCPFCGTNLYALFGLTV
jgi:hypothetical protein